MEPKRALVLAEPDTLFLPNLLAKLAARGLLSELLVFRPRQTVGRRLRSIARVRAMFGSLGTLRLARDVARARWIDRFDTRRFYSIPKVARAFDLELTEVSGFEDPALRDAIARNAGSPVFAQVTRRVPRFLLAQATFLNKHCAPLPSYGGVYPVFWAMLHGETTLGASIHEMDAGFDTGPIVSQALMPVGSHNFFSAYHQLYDLCGELLANWLERGAGEHVSDRFEPSYFSFPGAADRKRFLRRHELGAAFRLHPPVGA